VALLATVPASEFGFIDLGSSDVHRSCVGSVGSIFIAVSFLSLVGIVARFVALSSSVIVSGVAGPPVELVVIDLDCHIDVFYKGFGPIFLK
jgi:hypothetical protein